MDNSPPTADCVEADATFIRKILTDCAGLPASFHRDNTPLNDYAPWHLYCFDTVSSTMDVAKLLLTKNGSTPLFPPRTLLLPNPYPGGKEANHIPPSIFLAREQTHGRGRQGRSWFSSRDQGLYVTYVLFPNVEFKALNGFSLVGALAVLKTLEELGVPMGNRQNEAGWQVKVKWPNDVVCVQEGQEKCRKLAGILIESHSSQETTWVLSIGIGMNIQDTVFPAGICGTSLEEVLGRDQNYFYIFARLTKHFLTMVKKFFEQGFAPFLDLCWEHSLLKNKKIATLVDGKNEVFSVVGIDLQGGLRVVTAEGHERVIYSGEIELSYVIGN